MKRQKITLLSIILSAVLMIAAACGAITAFAGEPLTPFAAGSALQFVQVEGGLEHTLALTADGEIYSWGTGSATGNKGGTEPKLVVPDESSPLLSNEFFVKIAASLKASAAITNRGRLFVWGNGDKNANGSSPLFSGSEYSSIPIDYPRLLVIPHEGKTVYYTDIAAGDYHMLALATPEGDTKNILYGWGDNEFHQTGRDFDQGDFPWLPWEIARTGSADDKPLPTVVSNAGNLTAVFASGDTSAVVAGTSLFTFGRNEYKAEGITGYALGYTSAALNTQRFVNLKNVYGGVDLDNGGAMAITSVSLYRQPWNGGANIAVKPGQLSTLGFYKSVLSMGTLGTIYSSGSLSYFGYNMDGMFSVNNKNVSGRGNTGGSGLTIVAAPSITGVTREGVNENATVGTTQYIAAALNETSGRLYIWGNGLNTVGGNRKLNDTPDIGTFAQPYNFISTSIRFTALFQGYNCIYVLDNNGKIYVMGENTGYKLCNETTANGRPFPIEMKKTITEIAPANVSVIGYDKNERAFVGKNYPTSGDGYVNKITITPSSLYTNEDNFDVIQFLGYTDYDVDQYKTLYGETLYSGEVGINLTLNGVPIDLATNPYIKIDMEYSSANGGSTRLVITFKTKTPSASDVLTINFTIGKFANKFDIGENTCTLQSAFSCSIDVKSLNSAPNTTTRTGVDLPNMNPNNSVTLSATSKEQTKTLTNFFEDVDDATGGVIRFASAAPRQNIQIEGDENAPVSGNKIIGKYLDIEIIDTKTFKVLAKQTPEDGSEIRIKLFVTDGELTAEGTVRITIVASPTDEVKEIQGVIPRDDIMLAEGEIFYTVNLVSGESFSLNIKDMFADSTGFQFNTIRRKDDKDERLLLGNSSNSIYENNVITGVTMSADGGLTARVATFRSQKPGHVDYVVRLKGTDLYYVFRFFVSEIPAPELKTEYKNNMLLTGNREYRIQDMYNYAKANILVIKSIRTDSKNIYAEVTKSQDGKSFTIQPQQSGNLKVYLILEEEGNPSVYEDITLNFTIANYYQMQKVSVTAGPVSKPLEWFVNYINNSLTNSGDTVGDVKLERYEFITEGDKNEIPAANFDAALRGCVEIRAINVGGTEYLRFQLIENPQVNSGNVVVGIKYRPTGAIYSITVPLRIEGIHTWNIDFDVAQYKAEKKTTSKVYTPKEIAEVIGRSGPTVNTVSISLVKTNTPTNKVEIKKDNNTGELVINPKENGEYSFDLVLYVDGEYCFVSIDLNVSNLKDLPVMADYTTAFKLAIWISVGLIVLLLIIRIIRYVRRRALYKKEYEKYKMLTRIKKNTSDPNYADKEAVVRAKLKMLDPKYAKAYGEKKDGRSTQEKMDDKQKRIEELRTKLEAPRETEKEEVEVKPVKTKAEKTEKVEKTETATKEKEAKITAEKPVEKKTVVKEEARTEAPQERATVYGTGTAAQEQEEELSERDILEEKIKARLAEEQAEAEAKAAAEKAEEEKFQSMSKEERKKAELLKKLKAKYKK